MEALSKVGLAQRQSAMHSSPRDSESVKTGGTTFNITNPANASGDVRVIDTTNHCQTKSSPASTLTSAEVTHRDFNSFGGKKHHIIKPNNILQERAPLILHMPKTESRRFIATTRWRSRVMTPSQPNHCTQTKTITPVKRKSQLKQGLQMKLLTQEEIVALRRDAREAAARSGSKTITPAKVCRVPPGHAPLRSPGVTPQIFAKAVLPQSGK